MSRAEEERTAAMRMPGRRSSHGLNPSAKYPEAFERLTGAKLA